MEHKSEAFSDYYQYQALWDESQRKDKIKALVGSNNLVLYFKKGDSIYGAPENSRVVFAKMKNPDEEVDKGWLEEANFMAINLEKALEGRTQQEVFKHSDLKSLKIISQEEAESALIKKSGNNIKTNLDQTTNDEPTPDSSPAIDKISEK